MSRSGMHEALLIPDERIFVSGPEWDDIVGGHEEDERYMDDGPVCPDCMEPDGLHTEWCMTGANY